jgi:riboflavin synthase
MFTGIITQTTDIKHTENIDNSLKVTFSKPQDWNDLELGESVSTSGVCLTVATIRDTEYDCILIPETLSKTVFGKRVPKVVNLERAMKLNDRLGGHIVQGHVDGIGRVINVAHNKDIEFTIEYDKKFDPLVINKGSITIDGVSLTVAQSDDQSFRVSLIPFTLEHTTLGTLAINDEVNLEFDLLGKYVMKQLNTRTIDAKS